MAGGKGRGGFSATDPKFFENRFHGTDETKPGDIRGAYQHDRGRVVHSAAFRRLQGKTQVMGVGEGDFHRTRLTHSIECAQIGCGILEVLSDKQTSLRSQLATWLPARDLIEAACFSHDIGHPPFGHGGEKALHQVMVNCGGFEGNGQTLRILCKLEKYSRKGWGINPTRRLLLAVLKYPVNYGSFDSANYQEKPPKCYFDDENEVVRWVLEGFEVGDRQALLQRDDKDRPKNHSLDCSIMELADDIAYGIHDIEDIVARKLVERDEVVERLKEAFAVVGGKISNHEAEITGESICDNLFGGSFNRKQTISRLVNLFVTNVNIVDVEEFKHPLLRYQAQLPNDHHQLLTELKNLSFSLIIRKAEVQQLERRGQQIVGDLFDVLIKDPKSLIPESAWKDSDDSARASRRVCDYVSGMTDGYAEKVYRRLFIPGFGNSADEL